MMKSPGLVAVLVLSLLLAGCGGKAGPASPSQAATGPQDVPVLSGYVLDPSVEPVVGALVSIHGTNSSAVTDAAGLYDLPAAPVGAPIVVIVEAPGFVTSSKSVTIPEESVVVLNFTLAPVPVKSSYVDYFPIDGFLSCQVAVVAQGETRLTDCSMGLDSNSKPLITFNVNPDLAGIVLELEWQAGSAAAETLNLTAETVNFGDADKVIAQTIGESVLKAQVSESLARQYYGGTGGTIRVRISAGAEPAADETNAGASGHVQQDFTLHISNFYVTPPDPNYSALNGQ
jgi:hypothetical protein